MSYPLPVISPIEAPPAKTVTLLASGDQRSSANERCWPTQRETEAEMGRAFEGLGWKVRRGSPERWSDEEPHGFLFSQAQGREVFEKIHPEAPLVIVESVWQYTGNVLAGLVRHRGPILIVCNWSGQWPGLVGALNLRGSLTKAGVDHAFLWGEDFGEEAFRAKLGEWCETGRIIHDLSHVTPLDRSELPAAERELGEALAAEVRRRPGILGVFDEGCMGMFNAIIPDHLLHGVGLFKERLSQSALFVAMGKVAYDEALVVRLWLDSKGMEFDIGPAADQLTEGQILEQCKMYIAAVRLADLHGCDVIGIQYQLGLAELVAASDLAEGMLNCSERPPVVAVEGPRVGEVIREGRPVLHFNEVDECAGLDSFLTERVWRAMGMCPDNTLHDVRWSDLDRSGSVDEEVWVFEISGAVPPSHLIGGWAGARGFRQPPMYFVAGGSSIHGQSKAGPVVWSRIFVADDALHIDLGLLDAVELPAEEMERRWNATTPQWPIMNAILRGVTRDQLMARHQANHIQVVYADDEDSAQRALAAKAAMAAALGIEVNLCGVSIPPV
jgi:hypothetical protein